MERPSASFRNGKYSILDDFCYADTIEKKDELHPNDNLIENNHNECSYPRNIKLMVSGKKMHC